MTAEPVEAPDVMDIEAQVNAEIARLREEGQLEVQVEPRCRICRDESTRMLVNNLLARMLTYRDIYDIIKVSINPARKKAGQRPINQRIITNHAKEHFAITNPAWAIYRSIGEKRAQQLGHDVENGVAGAVTHLAFLETVMHRGWEDLVDPETKVSYQDGASAAVRLADIEAKSAGQQQQAEMMAQINRIIAAVKGNVPQEMWERIAAEVRGEELLSTSQVPPALPQRAEDDDEDFDPGADDDFDEDDDHP